MLAAPAAAADKAWEVSAGLVDTDFDTGMNFSTAFVLRGERYHLSFNLIDWNVFLGESPGFRRETLPDGIDVCRELSTGRFAALSNCDDAELDIAGSVIAG